jgi:hypothetical protein
MSKSSLSLRTEKDGNAKKQTETIEIISNETNQNEKVELLNPEFAETPETVAEPSQENVASFEPIPEAKISETPDTPPQQQQTADTQEFASIDEYYDKISSHIEKLSKDQMPVLFAAESVDDLPVTVAVNTALRLTKKGLKCLLIDADPQRCAIAKVFDIQSDQIKNRAVATCIEKLSIWTNKKLQDASIDSLKKVFTSAAKKYDRVMIYAPNMNTEKICEKLPQVASNAIVFSNANNDDNKLSRFLDSADCRTLEVFPPAKAVL